MAEKEPFGENTWARERGDARGRARVTGVMLVVLFVIGGAVCLGILGMLVGVDR